MHIPTTVGMAKLHPFLPTHNTLFILTKYTSLRKTEMWHTYGSFNCSITHWIIASNTNYASGLIPRLNTRPLRNAEITHYRVNLIMFSCHCRHWKRQTCIQVRLQGSKDYTQVRTFEVSQKRWLAIFSRFQENVARMVLSMHTSGGKTWVIVLLIFLNFGWRKKILSLETGVPVRHEKPYIQGASIL